MSAERLRLETSILGDQDDDPKGRRISELEGELRQARREASDARIEADRAREDTSRALSMLRGQLSPLYRALQAVFGELDAAGVSDTPRTGNPGEPSDKVSPVWAAWKQKLSPQCGKVIDALLIHKDLNSTQICVAAQVSKGSISDIIYRLNKAGLIDKNGGRYSLKKL